MAGLDKYRLKEYRLGKTGYEALSYIESSGTQYINTGITGSGSIKTTAEIEIKSPYPTSWWAVFGACASNTNRSYLIGINGISTMTVQAGNSVYQDVTNAFSVGTRYEIILDGGKAYINGVQKTNLTPSSYTTPVTIAIFRQAYSSSSSMAYAKMKLFACKMWSSGVLVRDFIPVLRLSDSQAGLYDRVNNVFYENTGTGVFAYG